MKEYEGYMKRGREATRRERRERRQVALANSLAEFYRDIVEICESSRFGTIRPAFTRHGIDLVDA